jgi:hypothetical protein
MNDNERPDLPEAGTATGAEIDARLEHTGRELNRSRSEIAKLRESLDASLDGDHERASEILDELDAMADDESEQRTRTCIDCGAERPASEIFETEHGPVCAGECEGDGRGE